MAHTQRRVVSSSRAASQSRGAFSDQWRLTFREAELFFRGKSRFHPEKKGSRDGNDVLVVASEILGHKNYDARFGY